MNLDHATPSQIALHQAHKARMVRMSGRPMPVPLPTPPKPEPAPVERIRVMVRHDYETPKRKAIPAELPIRIIAAVADEFGITVDQMLAKGNFAYLSTARFVAIGLIMEMTRTSYPAIGRRLGGRDHTTIINGKKRIDELLQSEAFRNRFDQIKAELVG